MKSHESTNTHALTARSRYAASLHFHHGIVLTAVLVSLLYVILAVAFDAAGYVESMTVLVPVTLTALTLGFLMAFSRFGMFFALAYSLFTGLAAIFALLSRALHQPEIMRFLVSQLSTWGADAVNNKTSANIYVFIFEICCLVWWLTYLGVWSVFRRGYTWRAVVPAGIVLALNAYYAPNSLLSYVILFCMVALILLVHTNLAELQKRWRDQHVQYAQSITVDFLRIGLVYGAVVLALAWLLPGLDRNPQVRLFLAPVNAQWEEVVRQLNRLYYGLQYPYRSPGSTFAKQLVLGGPRDIGDDPLYTMATPLGRYWRAAVYDTYTEGYMWIATAQAEATFDAEANLSGVSWAMRQPLTQTITLLARAGDTIIAAQDLARASVPLSTTVRPLLNASSPSKQGASAGDAPTGEIVRAFASSGLEEGQSYQVVSNYSAVTAQALAVADARYPDEISETFLQLPANFSPRVGAEARRIVAGKTTAYDQAKAIEGWLRQIPYNDAIDAPPKDRDPVEYFLYDIHEGYCTYYATAMALMLRSLSVPARVVSGYATSTPEPGSTDFVIRADDAHTWVEVFFPTYGWIEFEPTGGKVPALNRSAAAPNAASVSHETSPGASTSAPAAPNKLKPLPVGELLPGQPLARRQLGLFTLVFMLVGGALGAWLYLRVHKAAAARYNPELPCILFSRLQWWAGRIGVRSTQYQTPYEQARTFSRVLPQGRDPIHAITHSYVRYRFRPHTDTTTHTAGDDRAGKQLFGFWKELEPILWRAWLHKLLRRPSFSRDRFTLAHE